MIQKLSGFTSPSLYARRLTTDYDGTLLYGSGTKIPIKSKEMSINEINIKFYEDYLPPNNNNMRLIQILGN